MSDVDAASSVRSRLASGELERMPTEIVVTTSGTTPAVGDILVDPVLLAEATGDSTASVHPVVGLEVTMVDDASSDDVRVTVIRLVEGAPGPASF